MALTTEQQTSHLSRLQQEVLTWDYYRMGGEQDAGASSGRTLREVPYTFASITEYLDVFEPLVLEERAAQLVRGDEEDIHPSTIGAVFRSERREGFHVVQFILGEEAMSEFHDNDLILVSKTDPAADQNADEDKGDREDKNDKADKADKAEDGATDEDAADAEDGLRRVYALGYVDGRDSAKHDARSFYLPEPAAKVTGNTAHKGALGDEDYARFRAVRNALASPRGAWYLMHLANMSTIALEWLALHAFRRCPSRTPSSAGSRPTPPRTRPGNSRRRCANQCTPHTTVRTGKIERARVRGQIRSRASHSAKPKSRFRVSLGPTPSSRALMSNSLIDTS